MRPIVLPNNPQDYNQVAELAKNSSVQDLNSPGTNYTREEALEELQNLINDWVSRGMPKKVNSKVWRSDQQKQKYKIYKKQIGDGYGTARGDLITATGQYCSYCEMPSLSNLQVEHVLPKSLFSTRALNWDNFLLACASCNSAKGAKPNQNLNSIYPKQPKNIVATAQAATDNLSISQYLWANRYWHNLANVPLPYKIVLAEIQVPKLRNPDSPEVASQSTGNRWNWGNPVSQNDQINLTNAYLNGSLTVDNGRWTLPVENSRASKYYGAVVIPNPGATQTQKTSVQHMIDLVNLNVIASNGSNQTIDRRVELRTEAVFKALHLRNMLNNANLTQKQNLNQFVSQQIVQSMAATGFWSVWLQVFAAVNHGQDTVRNSFTGTAQNVWVV